MPPNYYCHKYRVNRKKKQQKFNMDLLNRNPLIKKRQRITALAYTILVNRISTLEALTSIINTREYMDTHTHARARDIALFGVRN